MSQTVTVQLKTTTQAQGRVVINRTAFKVPPGRGEAQVPVSGISGIIFQFVGSPGTPYTIDLSIKESGYVVRPTAQGVKLPFVSQIATDRDVGGGGFYFEIKEI